MMVRPFAATIQSPYWLEVVVCRLWFWRHGWDVCKRV